MPRTAKEAISGTTEEKQTKSAKVSKKIIVDSSMSPDDVISLDSKGIDLIFEQKEKFPIFDETTIASLSSINKTRYAMAKDFHDTWRGDEHAAFVEKFQVDKQMMGSATDKLKVSDTDLHYRWTLPSKIADRRAQGYKILSEDEAATYLGPTGGHHEVGRLGQTELVLMGIPKELYEKRQSEKTKKNNELAGAYEQAAFSEVKHSGAEPFKPVDSAQDRGHSWQDLPAGE